MAVWDWIIVASYVAAAIGVGIYFTKKASKSTSDFFVAGRTLPWYIAGTSMVATTFAADTPLFVAGMSRQTGISSNWLWWSIGIGQIATIFFFARLWRRTEAVTDIEFVVQRYQPSNATSFLRVFKVFFDGVLVNCVTIAWVVLAVLKILKVILKLSDDPMFHLPLFGDVTPTILLLVILGSAVVIYTTLSGLYGVAYLDFVQFCMAMTGTVALGVIVYLDASGGSGLMAKLQAAPEFKSTLLNFFPDLSTFNILTFTFFVYIFVAWWAHAPGNGYLVQRLLATRSEKDALLAFLWFNICHYVLRPWPWIIVGILSLHYIPHIEDAETAFPMMIDMFLPVGLKGLMVTALLAAFMSTVDTQLNWGSSYLLNDFYRPFISKNKTAKHYVMASRVFMVLLTVIGLLIAVKLTNILGAFKYIVVLYSGIGTIMIARWYWWRVNAYAEISAIVATLIVANCAAIMLPGTPEKDLFAVRILITITVVTIVWIIVVLATSKKPAKQAIEFYSKMRIAGPGWKKVRQMTQIEPIKGEFKQNLFAWFSCTVFLYSLLLGIGKLIFHQWLSTCIYFVFAIVSGYILKKIMAKIKFL